MPQTSAPPRSTPAVFPFHSCLLIVIVLLRLPPSLFLSISLFIFRCPYLLLGSALLHPLPFKFGVCFPLTASDCAIYPSFSRLCYLLFILFYLQNYLQKGETEELFAVQLLPLCYPCSSAPVPKKASRSSFLAFPPTHSPLPLPFPHISFISSLTTPVFQSLSSHVSHSAPHTVARFGNRKSTSSPSQHYFAPENCQLRSRFLCRFKTTLLS